MPPRLSDPPIITLTTDFGLSDTYVGQMKGVILGLSPGVRIVDITHDIRPQQILQGAFLAQTAWSVFPAGTIHVAVVDPGVGTDRRALLIESPSGFFIGPDNGLLSAALPAQDRPDEPSAVEIPDGYRAIEISNARYMRRPTSATFHGRDIFSPAAAHISRGLDPGDLGAEVGQVEALPPFRAKRDRDGTLLGHVVHVDTYGNVITDIHQSQLPKGRFALGIDKHRVPGPYRTFADLDGIGAIVGSEGYLGIAAPSGDAAKLLEVDIGADVVLEPSGSQ